MKLLIYYAEWMRRVDPKVVHKHSIYVNVKPLSIITIRAIVTTLEK